MANILIQENGQIKYLESVNGAEYILDLNVPKDQLQNKTPNILINPDLSAVQGVDQKYWKIQNGSVVEMTQAEKDAIATSELTERKKTADNLNVSIREALEALIKVINLRLPAGQKITRAEMITAIKEEIK